MSDREFTTKTVLGMRLLALSTTAPSQPEVAPLVGPLFDAVATKLEAAGVPFDLSVATYEMHEDGSLEVVAGFVQDHAEVDGLEVVQLNPCEVVSTLHHGSMATIGESWGALMARVESEGWAFSGPCREVYLESPMGDQDVWVTELQQPVVRS